VSFQSDQGKLCAMSLEDFYFSSLLFLATYTNVYIALHCIPFSEEE